MDIFLGLDCGTSKLAVAALDLDGNLPAVASRPHGADVMRLPAGRHEQRPERLLEVAVELLREIGERLGDKVRHVRALGLTGQMHGVLLARDDLAPVTPLITWQDQRAAEPFLRGEGSFLDELIRRVGPTAFEKSGITPAAGYMGATLFWFKETCGFPQGTHKALMCHDWLAAKLADGVPTTDPTDAASSGLYNVRRWTWDEAICGPLGISRDLLPRVAEAGDLMGRLAGGIASATGLPSGTTVHAALGDNQASALASLREPFEEVLVNVGTGGQTSAVTDKVFTGPDIEARPFPGRKILSCGMSLCGGAAFTYLAEHYARAISEIAGNDIPVADILTRLVELAAEIPDDVDGLTVEPLFLGKRSSPSVRGSISRMTMENNTPGAWAWAFIAGMTRDLASHYRVMLRAGLEHRKRLVVSGNALRLSAVMRRAAMQEFDMPLAVPAWDEEAACGAALSAMVGTGALPSFEAAASLVRYSDGTEQHALPC